MISSNQFSKLIQSSTSRDAFIALFGNVLVAAAGMLFSIILARGLDGPGEFGVISALLAIATILSSLGDIGITSALINFLPKHPDSRQEILSLAFWAQTAIGIVMLGVLLLITPFGGRLVPGSSPVHFLLLGVIGFILSLQIFSVAIFRAEKKFLWVALIQGLDSWLKISFVTLLLLGNALQITTVLAASLLASALATLVGLSFEFRGLRFIFPKEHAQRIFKFTKWITLMAFFSVFIGRIDIIMLNALSNSYDAGIFAAAARVALVFVIIVSSLGSVVGPRFSGFTDKLTTKRYLKKLALLISGLAVFMLVAILFAPIIINLVFGQQYLPAIPVFRALTLAMIPFLYTIVTVNPLIYTFNKPDFVAKVTIVQVLTIIVIDYLLIPKIGAFAPTVALAASNLFVLILTGRKVMSLLK